MITTNNIVIDRHAESTTAKQIGSLRQGERSGSDQESEVMVYKQATRQKARKRKRGDSESADVTDRQHTRKRRREDDTVVPKEGGTIDGTS